MKTNSIHWKLKLCLFTSISTVLVLVTYLLLPISQGVTQNLSSSSTERETSSNPKPDLSRLKVTELIDKLEAESAEGIGSHATAWASGFIAIDEEPQFRGGMLGSTKPTTSPVMRELVRRGVAALPDLIDHLNDQRLTKLVITHDFGFGGMWQSDEYPPRSGDPKKQPSGVNTGLVKYDGIDQVSVSPAKYTIRVGDLCYVAVGQIVNRSLSAVRYQPTAIIVINSPVQTPTLVKAVKQDWLNLTAEQHQQSLSQDALSKYPYATTSALTRLLFYYPQEGEKLALKLLARPLYQEEPLWDFIRKRLVEESDPNQWKTLIDEFRKTYGQAAADAIPFRLHWIYQVMSVEQDIKSRERKERASKILTQLYPDYDPYTPSFINAANLGEQIELIKSLAKYQSKKVDQAVYTVFQSASYLKSTNQYEGSEIDELLSTCRSRLLGKDMTKNSGHE